MNKNREENFVYKKTEGKDLWLTFLPPTKKVCEKAPVYFLIPGGGWAVSDRYSMIQMSQLSVDALRNLGFAIVSIEYRVYKEDGVVMRDIITDCFDAARYVAFHAEELQVDCNKIVTSGHSAGGHLALMLAYAPHDIFMCEQSLSGNFQVVATATMSPPTILYDDETYSMTMGFDYSGLFLGCDTLENRKEASPITYVNQGSPATLLCVGSADPLVYPASSFFLSEKLEACRVPMELIVSENGGHCFEEVQAGKKPSVSLDLIQQNIVEFVMKYIQ